MTGLGGRIAKGGVVLVLLRLAIRAIGLVSIVVLFRILAPEDFGIVALATLVIGAFEILSEFGFEQSLLRNRAAERADYDLIFTLNALRGLLVAVGVLLLAWPAAAFLEEPRLMHVLTVLAVAPLIDGVQNVGTVDFAKKLEFHKEFKLKVSQKLVSFFITLAAAFLLRNYWALVVGVLSGKLAGLALGYAMHPYRPRWTLNGWRAVMGFSLWILGSNIINYLGVQADKVAVQKRFDASTVGIVRVAEEVSGMLMELVWPVEKALYAGYVAVGDQKDKLRDTLLTSVSIVAAIGIPVAIALGQLAAPVVAIVLGPKGAPAAALIQVYVLHGALRSSYSGMYPLFAVLNKPELNTKIIFVSISVRLAFLFTAFGWLGLMAVPWSVVVASSLSFLLMWAAVTRELSLRWFDLPLALYRSALSALVMVLAMRWSLGQLGAEPPAWLALPVGAAVGTASYLCASFLLWQFAGRPAGAERALVGLVRGALAARRAARTDP